MKKLSEQIRILERIDQLIRLKCTGTPKQLAGKLEVSETTVYRILDTMKQLDAPIAYSISRQSYVYEMPVTFKFGFYTRDISRTEAKDINAGLTGFGFLEKNDFFSQSQETKLAGLACEGQPLRYIVGNCAH